MPGAVRRNNAVAIQQARVSDADRQAISRLKNKLSELGPRGFREAARAAKNDLRSPDSTLRANATLQLRALKELRLEARFDRAFQALVKVKAEDLPALLRSNEKLLAKTADPTTRRLRQERIADIKAEMENRKEPPVSGAGEEFIIG